ncbi:MAG: hypothetical protein AB8B59_00425, partial [Maribacter sp.]
MKLTVREMELDDIEKIVDYFFLADTEFIKRMGADQSKLPDRGEWINKLESELQKPYINKEIYYIIWLLDNQAVGHS